MDQKKVSAATVTLRDGRSMEVRFNSPHPASPATAIMAANMAFGVGCIADVWLAGKIWRTGGFGSKRRARRVR